MTTALFIGRFQPFHKGHLGVVTKALKKHDHIYIVIGSSRKSHTPRNPFTAGERWNMVRNALGEEDIDIGKYNIFQIADASEGTIWRQRILNHVPKFDVVITHYGETSRLFRELGYDIEYPVFDSRATFKGSAIREAMVDQDSKSSSEILWKWWQTAVSESVYEYIVSIDGVERVKELHGTD